MRYYLFLSGEHPTLPLAEAQAAAVGEQAEGSWSQPHPRLALFESSVNPQAFAALAARLAFTHDAGLVLAEAGYDEGAWRGAWADALPPDARVAVRAERLVPDTAWRVAQFEARVGAACDRPVDLRAPTAVLRGFLLADRAVLGWRLVDRDPKDAAARHIKRRPFFSPVSLEPKWARAMLNLAQLRRRDLVVDPFCGTGGVLIEATSLGIRAAGSDLDPAMVAGTKSNLAYYGQRAEALVVCDVAAAVAALSAAGVGTADAVVADLPYGRSASTGREHRRLLYERAGAALPQMVRPGGRVVLGLPSQEDVQVVGSGLEWIETHAVRAHRSLTRHFAVFRRP